MPLNSLFVCLAILRIFTHSLSFLRFMIHCVWIIESLNIQVISIYFFVSVDWFFSQPQSVFELSIMMFLMFDSKTSGLCFLIDFKMSIFLFLALVWSDNDWLCTHGILACCPVEDLQSEQFA